MARRSRDLAWLLGLALAALAIGAMLREVSRRGRFAVARSSYSTADDGTKALALLARAHGRQVRAWGRDLTALPRGRGVLVACGDPWDGPARPLRHAEQTALVRWIDGGGALVVLGASGYLPDSVGVLVGEPEEQDKDLPSLEQRRRRRTMPWDDPVVLARLAEHRRVVHATLAPHPLAAGLAELSLIAPAHLKRTEHGEVEGVADDRFGDWELVASSPKEDLVLVRAIGRGRLAVVASASFATNAELAHGDHAELALRLLDLGHGPVLFDEMHLGMASADSLLGYLRERGLLPAILQALAALALLVWRAGARFGNPRPPEPAAAPDVTTYVDAVGRIYARAGDVGGSMERLAAHALARVAARHGVRGEGADALARALRERGRLSAAAAVGAVARRLTTARAALGRGRAAERALVEFAHGLDEDIAPALAASSPAPAPSPSPETTA